MDADTGRCSEPCATDGRGVGYRYASCSLTQKPTHGYRPFFLPRGLYLANVPKKHTLPAKIPIVRTEDGFNASYFYLASGCSDLFAKRPRRYITANNRIDALTKLVGPEGAMNQSGRACHGWHSVQEHQLLCNYAPGKPLLARSLIEHGGGCLDYTLLAAMHEARVAMAVLWFQNPGYPFSHSPRGFKTEILFAERPVFFDARNHPCVISDTRCFYCNSSVRTRKLCESSLSTTPRIRGAPPLRRDVEHARTALL